MVWLLVLFSLLYYTPGLANIASSRLVNHSNIPGIEVFNTYAQFRIVPIDALSSKIFHDKEVLPIMVRFDWVIYGFGKIYCINNSQTSNPQTILYRPFLLNHTNISKALSYFSDIPRLSSAGEVRSLVFAGSDIRLSYVLPTVQKLVTSGKFSHIWYEAKDVYCPDVLTIPMGLTPYYLLSAGFHAVAQAIAASATVVKKYWVCAAWGRFSPYLDEKLPTRHSLTAFAEKAKWFARVRWTPAEYWQNLPLYRFSLTPEGMGVQSPKLFECLLVRTIPITNRHPAAEDLHKLGFPIIVVDRWEEVTMDMLQYEFKKLAMTDSKWEEVRTMLTIDGIMKLVQQGHY